VGFTKDESRRDGWFVYEPAPRKGPGDQLNLFCLLDEWKSDGGGLGGGGEAQQVDLMSGCFFGLAPEGGRLRR